MLGRIISVPLALILALLAGSQSLSDGSAQSNCLPALPNESILGVCTSSLPL